MNGSSKTTTSRGLEEKDKPGGSVAAVADTVLDLGRDLDQDPGSNRSRPFSFSTANRFISVFLAWSIWSGARAAHLT
jgi:hypothetical protein